jgi:hypothetical protein
MVSIMANGLAGNTPITTENADYETFKAALYEVLSNLTRMLAKDGEGASKLLECICDGAPDKDTAITVAKSVVCSSLFKAAMFGEDAKEASKILGLTLTARADTPMCGVPFHSANTYIAKLLKAGRKVAICEQTSSVADPKTKLFERQITRIITPGTILEEAMLDAKASNYLVSIQSDAHGWGLACLEASTGDFWITQNKDDADFIALADLLGSINPAEILASKETLAKRTSLFLWILWKPARTAMRPWTLILLTAYG